MFLMLPIAWSLGALLACLGCCGAALFGGRRFAQESQRRVSELQQQADRASAAQQRGELGRRSGRAAAAAAPSLHRDSLLAPLLDAIPEDASDSAATLPPQSLDELPQCVQTFLVKAIRDGRRFKLFSLQQKGQLKLDARGGWKETEAVQRACPLEPAFVWTASVRLAPLVSLKGCDAFANAAGECAWQLWGAVPAAGASGREVDQALLLRWLAEAPCFPAALLPSRFLRWNGIKGEDHEAEAVLTYGGRCVRATFTFDRWGRVARLASHDFWRRGAGGAYESGELQVAYSGHMLFGLSPQGPVMQEEVATHAGVFVPTNLDAAWVGADGVRVPYAKLTVARITAEL